MSAIRVFLFLVLLVVIVTPIVRYMILALLKLKLKEEKVFEKTVKQSKVNKDIEKLYKNKKL